MYITFYTVFTSFVSPLYSSIDTNMYQYVRIKKLLLLILLLFETTNPSNHNGIQLTIICFDKAIYSPSTRLQSDRKPKSEWHKATVANS